MTPSDSGGQIGTQKPAIRRFIGQPPDRGQSQVDSRRSVMLLFHSDPIPRDDRFVDSQSWFRAIPFDELKNRMIVGSLRTAKARLLSTADFDCSRSGSLRTVFGGFFLLVFRALPPVAQIYAHPDSRGAYLLFRPERTSYST